MDFSENIPPCFRQLPDGAWLREGFSVANGRIEVDPSTHRRSALTLAPDPVLRLDDVGRQVAAHRVEHGRAGCRDQAEVDFTSVFRRYRGRVRP